MAKELKISQKIIKKSLEKLLFILLFFSVGSSHVSKTFVSMWLFSGVTEPSSLLFRLVLSLNCSSLLFCCLVLPFSVTSVILRAQSWKFGEFWCQIVGFLTLLSLASSSPTIALIAIDR